MDIKELLGYIERTDSYKIADEQTFEWLDEAKIQISNEPTYPNDAMLQYAYWKLIASTEQKLGIGVPEVKCSTC